MKTIKRQSVRMFILIPAKILLVFMLAGCSKSSTSGSGPGPDEVFIQGMAFSPATLTVPVNTTVTWTNKDAVVHNVTSNPSVFSSGSLNQGSSYSFTFSTAGTYNYICTIHPYMSGKIIVQ